MKIDSRILKKIGGHLIILFILCFPLIFAHAQCEGDCIQNPLGNKNSDVLSFFNTILDKIVIPIGAILAVIFIIYSGYLFVTAGGSEDKIKTAKSNLMYVVIGAAIILGAKAIAAGIKATLDSLNTT